MLLYKAVKTQNSRFWQGGQVLSSGIQRSLTRGGVISQNPDGVTNPWRNILCIYDCYNICWVQKLLKISIFCDITPCSPLIVNRRLEEACHLHIEQTELYLPFASLWILAGIILHPWRWRRHVPPKLQLTFNGLHGVISQKIRTFHNHRCENFRSYIEAFM
jgi:hypothetical protein